MKCQVDEVDSDAGESDEVAQGGKLVVADKAVPVGLVFWILLTEFSVALLVGGKANLSTKAMLLLDLPHHQQVVNDSLSEPLCIQPCHDHSHKEQSHLSWKQNHELGPNYRGREERQNKIVKPHRCPERSIAELTCIVSCQFSRSLGWYTAYIARLTVLLPNTQ